MNDLSFIDLFLNRYTLPFYALGIIFTGIGIENSRRRKQAKRIINNLIEHHLELLESLVIINNVSSNESKELLENLNKINGFVCYEIVTIENGRIELKNMTLIEILKKIPSAQEKMNQFPEVQKSLQLSNYDKIIDIYKLRSNKMLFVCYSKFEFPFIKK